MKRETDTTSLDHVAIVVRDLDRAVALYRDWIGLALERVEDLPERGVRVAFLRAGASRIELVQPIRDDSEVSAFLERRGEGLHHVAFQVPDLARVLSDLGRAGMLVEQEARAGADGTRVAFLHPKRTGGVLIELVEHESRHPGRS